VDELLPEPNARPACVLRVNFLPIGTSTNGVGSWIDVREFEQADQCKRIFGKAFGDRAVFSVGATDPCASRTSGVDVNRSLEIVTVDVQLAISSAPGPRADDAYEPYQRCMVDRVGERPDSARVIRGRCWPSIPLPKPDCAFVHASAAESVATEFRSGDADAFVA
jgi:hypothetical protein